MQAESVTLLSPLWPPPAAPPAARPPIEVRQLSSLDPLQNPLFSQQLHQRYLIFDAFVAGKRRVDLHPLVLSADLHRRAVAAAQGVYRAVSAAAAVAHDDPAERARYGLHDEILSLAAASRQAGDTASLCRVDLLYDEQGGFQACEINADCPGGHNESLGLPQLAQAAGFWDGLNPTTLVAATAKRLAALAGGGAVALIYATAYAEDLQVCALLRRALLQHGVEAVLAPPTAPVLRGGKLYVGDQPVSALYRYFPAEYMEGQNNVPDIARAVRSGAVRTLASFAEIFPQSKLAFARAIALRESLSADDQAAIAAYLPHTLDAAEVAPATLVREQRGWVLKRALGRVGDEVFVGALIPEADWPLLVDVVRSRRQAGEVWVAQRFVPQRAIPTPYGPRLVTLGAYLLDGEFVGYFARITPQSHVSHDALCVPVFTAPPEMEMP